MSLVPLRLMASALSLQVARREGGVLGLSTGNQSLEAFLPIVEGQLPAGAHGDVWVKVLGDNNLALQDEDCASVPYSVYYEDSSSEHFNLLSLRGNISVSEAEVQSFFRVTREGTHAEILLNRSDYSLTLQRPGRVAVCYCGHSCGAVHLWRLLLHFTVRGPSGAQAW